MPAAAGHAPQRRRRPRQRRWTTPAGIGAVAVLMLVVLAVLYYQRGGSPSQAQPAASPAPVEGQTIDGIRCETMEQALFHVHLAIYAAGQPRRVPYGIGIPDADMQQTPQGPFVAHGSCFYWLHSHTEDGVIHVESPVQRTFTLGDYFDVWGSRSAPHGSAATPGR